MASEQVRLVSEAKGSWLSKQQPEPSACEKVGDASLRVVYWVLRGIVCVVTLCASEMTQAFPTYESFKDGESGQ